MLALFLPFTISLLFTFNLFSMQKETFLEKINEYNTTLINMDLTVIPTLESKIQAVANLTKLENINKQLKAMLPQRRLNNEETHQMSELITTLASHNKTIRDNIEACTFNSSQNN